ncbi:unnamed protein product [Caenorhabditis brenneri]
MTCLPLLKLPFLALKEVLRCCTPIELYFLGVCSKKAGRAVSLVAANRFSIKVDVYHGVLIINKKYKLQVVEHRQYFKGKRSFHLKGRMRCFYDDSDEKLAIFLFKKFLLIDFVIDFLAVLKSPVRMVLYGKDACNLRYLLNWIQDNQRKPLEKLTIWSRIENDDMEWILQNVKVTNKLYISIPDQQEFEVNFRPECERLMLSDAKSITLENLLSFDSCSVIQIYGIDKTKLSSNDLDVFMKKWKEGAFPKLEYLRIEYVLFKDQILGFSKTELQQMQGMKRMKTFNGKELGNYDRGQDVQSDDGTKATIQWNNYHCFWKKEGKYIGTFELFVWRN